MSLPSTDRRPRHRADRCPGVLRPWPADDGSLLRIRLVGGVLQRSQLLGLAELAGEYGDGNVHVTARANVQLRGLPDPVPTEVVEGLVGLGLVPSRAHDRVRNVMMSPLTGRLGGRADLRPVAAALDTALCADPELAGLPARFLFCLDDRGDLSEVRGDLVAVAATPDRARLWAGGLAGETVRLVDVPARLVQLAREFLSLRGTGPSAAWHVEELPGGGADLGAFRPAVYGPATPRPPLGSLVQDDGSRAHHRTVPDGLLTPTLLGEVLGAAAREVIVTPWRSVVLPDVRDLP